MKLCLDISDVIEGKVMSIVSLKLFLLRIENMFFSNWRISSFDGRSMSSSGENFGLIFNVNFGLDMWNNEVNDLIICIELI